MKLSQLKKMLKLFRIMGYHKFQCYYLCQMEMVQVGMKMNGEAIKKII